MSQMNACLFTEDRYSTSSGSGQEACDCEVSNITWGCTPSDASTIVMSPRPGSNSTVDYSTQHDPGQPPPHLQDSLSPDKQWIKKNHNFLLPDGSGRRIFDISTHERHFLSNALENGNNAYQVKLPNLEPVLETSTYLMDEITGQFHAVYADGYRQMATTKRMLYPWQQGQLVAELQETRCQFGLPQKQDTSPAPKPATAQHVRHPAAQQGQSQSSTTADKLYQI